MSIIMVTMMSLHVQHAEGMFLTCLRQSSMLCTFSPIHIRPLICVEVGSGSGVVLTFLATLLKIPAFFWQVI